MLSNTQKSNLGLTHFFVKKAKTHGNITPVLNVLIGLEARCDFGNQTEGLVHDIFVFNMNNKQVQEKLCTDPKQNPAEA